MKYHHITTTPNALLLYCYYGLYKFYVHYYVLPGIPKLVSPKAKAGKILFTPIKPTNPLVQMAYKSQSSFGIIAILHNYPAYKTLFWPIKPTSQSVQMVYKDQCSFGIIAILYTYPACKTLFWLIKPISPNGLQRPEQFWNNCNMYLYSL